MKNKMKLFALAVALIINIRMIVTWDGGNVIVGLIGTGAGLLLIIFPEKVSKAAMFTGGIRRPKINKETPGCFVAVFGWAILLLMVIFSAKV